MAGKKGASGRPPGRTKATEQPPDTPAGVPTRSGGLLGSRDKTSGKREVDVGHHQRKDKTKLQDQ